MPAPHEIGYGLPERQHVGLGAPLEEADFKRSVADRVVLAYQSVQAPVAEQALPVLVGVDAARAAGSLAVEKDAGWDPFAGIR